jgi:hypothetical protein
VESGRRINEWILFRQLDGRLQRHGIAAYIDHFFYTRLKALLDHSLTIGIKFAVIQMSV